MAIRKILLLPLIFLSCIFYCHAGTGSFTVGVDAGLGLSALYGRSGYLGNVSNLRQAELSASAGMNFRYNFSKIVSIVSGIYYYQFGYSRYRLDSLSLNGPHSRGGYNTINIPLLARVSFGKKAVFFVEAGPYLSIGLNSAYLLAGSMFDGGMPQMFWLPTNPINAGFIAGGGIEVPLPHRFALSFEARSNVSFTNIVFGYTKLIAAHCCADSTIPCR